jgi:hypothetical protein
MIPTPQPFNDRNDQLVMTLGIGAIATVFGSFFSYTLVYWGLI